GLFCLSFCLFSLVVPRGHVGFEFTACEPTIYFVFVCLLPSAGPRRGKSCRARGASEREVLPLPSEGRGPGRGVRTIFGCRNRHALTLSRFDAPTISFFAFFCFGFDHSRQLLGGGL